MAVYQNRQRIPFTISHGDLGSLSMGSQTQTVVHGVVGLEEGVLVLQHQQRTSEMSMSTMLTSTEVAEVEEVLIPLDALASVHCRGWFGRKVIISANDMVLLSKIPGSKGEKVVLRFKWRDRSAADDLVTKLQFALGDLGMARLDSQIRKLEGRGGGEVDRLGDGGA